MGNKKPATKTTPRATSLCMSRQLSIFDPEKHANKRVDVIGVGATGSAIVWQLAKTGMRNIHVWDDDIIETHNIANQSPYLLEHIDMLKVDALKKVVFEATGVKITTHAERVDGTQTLGSIVFLLVDRMDTRVLIWNNGIKYRYGIDLMIETRMGSDEGRVYCIHPMKPQHIERWESSLCKYDEAEMSACGTIPSIICTAGIIADLAVWQMINWLMQNEENIFKTHELFVGTRPPAMTTRNFG